MIVNNYSNFIHCQLTNGETLSQVLASKFNIQLNTENNNYTYIKKIGISIIDFENIIFIDNPIILKIKSIIDDNISSLTYDESEYIIGVNGVLDFQNVKILDVTLLSDVECYIDLILTNTAYDNNILDITKPFLPIFPSGSSETDRNSWVEGAIMGNYIQQIEPQMAIIGNQEKEINSLSNMIINKDFIIIEDDIEEKEEDLQ